MTFRRAVEARILLEHEEAMRVTPWAQIPHTDGQRDTESELRRLAKHRARRPEMARQATKAPNQSGGAP